MLVGQTISATGTLLISLLGMAVVMLELALLALFIVLMTKVLAKLSPKQVKDPKTAAVAPIVSAPADFDVEEMAMVLACICAETGKRPEEVVIRSIKTR